MTKDQSHPLTQIEWGVIAVTSYRGCLVERLVGGFRVLGKDVVRPEDVDRIIDENCKVIEKSFK